MLFEISDACQVIVVLVEVQLTEDGGLVPGTSGLQAPRAATVMAQVQQPGVSAVLELLIVNLDGWELLLQLLHPHGHYSSRDLHMVIARLL